jgi:hypothetical protein
MTEWFGNKEISSFASNPKPSDKYFMYLGSLCNQVKSKLSPEIVAFHIFFPFSILAPLLLK